MKWYTITIIVLIALVALFFLSKRFKYQVLDALGIKKNTWDHHTNKRIEKLHPKIQNKVAKAINELDKKHDIKVRVTDGYRTIEKQNELYQKGRTRPGDIVTNAKGGQSYHNYGLAFDVVQMFGDDNDQPNWSATDWETISKVFKKYGFSWGASFGDRPHFYKPYGHNWKQLKAKVNKGDTYKNYPIV